jgi:hypothetical protein
MNKYQEALNRIAKYCGVNNGSMLEDEMNRINEDKGIACWATV